MNLGRGLVLTFCTCSALLLSSCGFDSPSKAAVVQYLDAYKNQDFKTMAQFSADTSLTELPLVLTDLPEELITQYRSIFTSFSYNIEREEALGDGVNVYVSISYADCGSASRTAFNDYLNELSNAPVIEAPEALLADKLSHSLSANVKTTTETFIIPVKKVAQDQYKVQLSEPLKNALTANINLFSQAIAAYNESYRQ